MIFDIDTGKLTLEFHLDFSYPVETDRGYIRIELADGSKGMNYGDFRQLAVEGNGPPIYLYQDKCFRSAAALEQYVASEFPLLIIEQIRRQKGRSKMSQQEPKKGFEHWAVIELFGHNTIAGMVTEESIGGASFIRVDVPQTDEDHPAFTKYYGGAAIYGISPCSEEIARHAASRLRVRPVQGYILPEPKREPSQIIDGMGDGEGDYDEEGSPF